MGIERTSRATDAETVEDEHRVERRPPPPPDQPGAPGFPSRRDSYAAARIATEPTKEVQATETAEQAPKGRAADGGELAEPDDEEDKAVHAANEETEDERGDVAETDDPGETAVTGPSTDSSGVADLLEVAGETTDESRRGLVDSESQRTEITDEPASFDAGVWARVPDRIDKKDKTRGIFTTPDGQEVPLASGYDGPAAELPKPRTGTGMNNINVAHVEAHAAATMRLNDISEGTLYLNNEPCPGRIGCDSNLPRMLAPSGKLTVYAPDDFCKVYRGLPLEER